MDKIYTTISKNYIPEWGYIQGIREIVQNALDSHDQGNKMDITYLRKNRQLLVYNRNTSLSRASLLLGSSNKSSDVKLRGVWGEGYKLSALCLVRSGKPVTIFNGSTNERWEAAIDYSEQFDSEVLTFNIIKRNPIHKDKLLFQIDNIQPMEWKSLRTWFLTIYMPEKGTYYKTRWGKVLLDKALKGKIYCGSIFVADEKELEYGYDFNPDVLNLNRDRNMVNSFDLLWNTSRTWAYLCANEKGKLFDVKKMLKANIPDVKYMESFSDYTVTGKIVDEFFKENTEMSYPVENKQEAVKVRSLGYSPVYSSSSYTSVIKKKLGTIEDLERRVELDWELFQFITPIQDANIQWVFEVMFRIDPKFKFKMQIAKFKLDTTRSTINKNDLVVNCNLLHSKYEILHEAINFYAEKTSKRSSVVWKSLYKQTVEGMLNDKFVYEKEARS